MRKWEKHWLLFCLLWLVAMSKFIRLDCQPVLYSHDFIAIFLCLCVCVFFSLLFTFFHVSSCDIWVKELYGNFNSISFIFLFILNKRTEFPCIHICVPCRLLYLISTGGILFYFIFFFHLYVNVVNCPTIRA